MTPLSRDELVERIARDIPDGAFVNLGIGLPDLIPKHIPKNIELFLQSENGLLHMGPPPPEGQEDWDLINAGKQAVTILPGGSYFDSALSFTIMRGGHLDLSVLGAFQVSENGDLANWSTGDPTDVPAVGGAMDLASGAKLIWVVMEHTTKTGEPRIVHTCKYPLTAKGVVRRIYTNLAVIDVTPDGLLVREIVPDGTMEELQAVTEAPLRAAPDLKHLVV